MLVRFAVGLLGIIFVTCLDPSFSPRSSSIHNQPCHVVYTDYRPTPLQHYVFPAGGDGLHLVVDEKGTFRYDFHWFETSSQLSDHFTATIRFNEHWLDSIRNRLQRKAQTTRNKARPTFTNWSK